VTGRHTSPRLGVVPVDMVQPDSEWLMASVADDGAWSIGANAVGTQPLVHVRPHSYATHGEKEKSAHGRLEKFEFLFNFQTFFLFANEFELKSNLNLR
jgi:hypothetical protein